MLKITKSKFLQDDLTASWHHLQYSNMKSFRRIRAIHISTINCRDILFITFFIDVFFVACAAVFTICFVRNCFSFLDCVLLHTFFY